MSLLPASCGRSVRRGSFAPLSLAFLVGLCSLGIGCQKDDHPPYAAGCVSNCTPFIGSVGYTPPTGTGTGTGGGAATDGGTGMLSGEVLSLTDDTFGTAALFAKTATVSAVGGSVPTVSANWDGVDTYSLSGVASLNPNWVSVKPDDVQGDALVTYQAVATSAVSTANLAVVSAEVLDGILTEGQSLRSSGSGQIVLFFRSAGTSALLSGLHVTMAAAKSAIYKTTTGWVVDDGTTVTGSSGLVVFANVDTTNSAGGTQVVTVTRPATPTAAAVNGGSFAVKVVADAVTMASVAAQL